MNRVLIGFQPMRLDELAEVMPKGVRVVQALPPRLAIVEGEAADIALLAKVPRITVLDEADTLPDANDAEAMFQHAFALNRLEKHRPGEGLPWDTAGFEAP